jgi:uncharacterized protein (DUF488 family)
MLNNQLSENENWIKNDTEKYADNLTITDQKILNDVHEKFKDFSETGLIKYVYSEYPEFTINSELLEKYNIKPYLVKTDDSFAFFTIGYEGHSIDSYLQLLIKNNIKLLCDVRKNPVSMKYGFSKNQLIKFLGNFQIKYAHIPELGIDSDKRQELATPDDYNKLFKSYYKNIPGNLNQIEQLINLFKQYKRIAITCFESDYKFCHRHKITEYLQNQKDWTYNVIHI